MAELSRRQFVTALFGSAAALASPAFAELPSVIKLPARQTFARRTIRRFWFESKFGHIYRIFRDEECWNSGGVGPGGQIFWSAMPGSEISLLPEQLLRVELQPLPTRQFQEALEFHYEGVDFNEEGLERPFYEKHLINNVSAIKTEIGSGHAIFAKEWHASEERHEWLFNEVDEEFPEITGEYETNSWRRWG